jgi:cell division protein FtsB
MSRWGTIGLWLNLALGIFFAVWGFGVYSNRMDWKAETKERADQLKKISDARNKSLTELYALRPRLQHQESRRPDLDRFYADQLEKLRSGKERPKALTYNKGVLVYDAKDLPQLGEVVNSAGQPINGLASLDVLEQQYVAVQAQIAQMIKEETDLVEEEKKLTIQLNGDGAQKGLRGDLANALAAQQKSLERQEYLMPLLYNRQAELEVLTKRKEGLEARLRELQASSVARRP